MAHFCPDCKITFENRVSNCPLCGYGIASDAQPESFYINQGYTRFNRAQQSTSGVHIQDDDILNHLKNKYNNYVNTVKTPTNNTPTSSSADQQPHQSAPSNDFFASFTNTNLNTPETNNPQPEPEVEPEPQPDPISVPEFTDDTRTNNYYTPRRRVYRNFRFPSRISFRTIWRLALFIIAIICIVSIWNMRFVILDSVVGFISAILPAALILIGIFYLLRNMFR